MAVLLFKVFKFMVGRQVAILLFNVPKSMCCWSRLKQLLYCWTWSPSRYTVVRGPQMAVQLVKVLKSIYYWSASCCTVDWGNQVIVHILLVEVSKLLYFWPRSPHGCVVGQGLELFTKLLYFWLRSPMLMVSWWYCWSRTTGGCTAVQDL